MLVVFHAYFVFALLLTSLCFAVPMERTTTVRARPFGVIPGSSEHELSMDMLARFRSHYCAVDRNNGTTNFIGCAI